MVDQIAFGTFFTNFVIRAPAAAMRVLRCGRYAATPCGVNDGPMVVVGFLCPYLKLSYAAMMVPAAGAAAT